MASPRDKDIKLTVTCTRTPPQVVISKLNKVMQELRDAGLQQTFSLKWELGGGADAAPEEEMPPSVALSPSHPRGYRESGSVPVLRGGLEECCPHCLCGPCVIALPPDFLIGACGPHPANDEKRHRLYRKFWRLLQDVGLWGHEEYLQRKERRTVRHDRRDIMPKCVIEEIRRRYPSVDGNYRDYLSTFDAENM